MRRMRWGTPYLRRQYVVAAVAIAVLVVGIFVVFGQLLVGQLSRSYLEDVLLSGKVHAEEVARQFTSDEPTYKVIEQRREALYQLSEALKRQDIIERIRFYDERGKLAFAITLPSEGYIGRFPEGHSEFVQPTSPDQVTETEQAYQVTVPMGEYGTVVADLSKKALAGRITVLRRQLVAHTAMAAGMTVIVLGAAVGFIWHLLQRNAELEERRRRDEELAILGSLAANLAHEIRNPLNALSLNLEILDEELAESTTDRRTVGQARREVGRLSSLVNDFLVYARPTPPSLERCDVGVLLDEVAGLLGPVCEKAGVELRVDAAKVSVTADRGQLSQVLMNLAINAIQAMEGGQSPTLQLGGHREGETIVLEVLDSGPGIPVEELEKVRLAFYSRRKGGTGLGLSIADRIVEEHGGSLTLVNRPEGGLAARLTLPAA